MTGGSAGIGLAIASRLIGEGAAVTICGRRAEALAAAQESLGERASAEQLDVADAPALQALIRAIESRHGRFDFLVNNAMHVGWSAIGETSLSAFQKDFRINVDAAFAATQAAMEIMVAQGRGAIVNIASINGLQAIDNMAAYSASKAALVHFSRCAAMECAPHGVRVNAVAPGVIATPSTAEALGACRATPKRWRAGCR